MRVNELSKELEVINRDIITLLKEKGFKVSSHMSVLTDEMIDIAREHFKNNPKQKDMDELEVKPEPKKKKEVKHELEGYIPKQFAADERIPCRSVTPWKLTEVGADRMTVYNWHGFGDVDYVTFKDLQYFRRKSIIKDTKVIIEDPDLCYQWRRELGDTYKHFLGVEYPEEFFDLSDEKFRKLLLTAPNTVKEVIKFTAMNMVRNENYPSVHKLMIIDEILGTCIKDFL